MIQTGSERFLLIYDEEFQVDLGKRMLERLGYTVTARTDSIGALKWFRLSKKGHHDQTN
jgi:CheY-like chemotaxis protein